MVSHEGVELVKFKLPYREIQGLGPAPKTNQFVLKIPQMSETYITDSPEHKETVLAFLHDFRKRVSRKGEENNIDLLQMKAFTEEVSFLHCSSSLWLIFFLPSQVISATTIFSNVAIAKMDGERVYSFKYLKDATGITTVEVMRLPLPLHALVLTVGS